MKERFCRYSSRGGHYAPDIGFTMERDSKGKPCGMICAVCKERRHAAQAAAKKAMK